ncbi:hypothetical protein [Streptomyces sp. NPDC059862]|uniref:hypothetical protein n=1 Tax=unclassified Streptomyces TaxID=2593676 RepID=UPI00363FCB26
MPRGRHRHSPPLHRLLPPSAIAGVSLVCALGPWVFTEPTVLRGLAAAAAVTAVAGAVVLRRWDTQAGKQVADLTRARASDEWRHEERVAELETDLEESRELRVKLEQRLRAKRAELAGLRNEHAALLRRYATAETERASALEGRRLLEIEAATPARALPPVPTTEETEAVAAPADPDDTDEVTAADETDTTEETDEQKAAASGLFSPEGSRLFLRARAALIRFDADTEAPPKEHADQEASPQQPVAADAERVTGAEAAQEDEARGKSEAADGHERAAATTTADTAPSDDNAAAAPAESVPATARPAAPVQQPSGHFTVPTAVAVVPASAPVRRPTAEGGFDFFGTKANASAALEAVQNEDLADVVGQEALDLHKAEAEAEFKPAGEESRGIGQVIDLTAHDETEQIDVQELRGLRSAVS